MKFYFLLLVPILFSSCIFIKFNNDFDVHTAYFKNDSSHNIYLQHYSRDHNDLASGNFFAHGIIIPKHTLARYAAPLYDNDLEKILIVDADTRKLMKKITGTDYYDMLTRPQVIVENNSNGGKTTSYNYYFIITDDFLDGN
ncbi:MAG: hypothetical protein LBI06_02120 [Treponema sp.]|jgi:hypothetical protein|nr:hypothetical protein [Treponema sp.]